MTLTEITTDWNVELDIRYATEDNVTGTPLYTRPVAYLHPAAAEKLKKTIQLAAALGYRIKIFDAFRPLEVQQKLWDHTPDPEFISNPETGSCPHCRGVAIDLTLIDKAGKELDMGTGFDAFTKLSWHANTEVNETAQRNRFLLLGIMSAAGWDFYSHEWWHYQLFKPRDYDLLTDAKAGTGML